MRKVLLSFVLICCAVSARAGSVTIAALGDSLTQGYGLAQGNGFVPQLQAWLTRQGADAVLINAGVSGDTTAGGAARVGWTLTPDVDAMIVTLGGNDVLRGIDPVVSRANLETILRAARQADVQVLLVGMRAPGNFGPDYKTAFEQNYADLSQQYGTLFEKDFFGALSGPGGDPAAMQPFMQADGIHPNAEGVLRIVDALGPAVLDLIEAAKDR